jgi:hypothetical protein
MFAERLTGVLAGKSEDIAWVNNDSTAEGSLYYFCEVLRQDPLKVRAQFVSSQFARMTMREKMRMLRALEDV